MTAIWTSPETGNQLKVVVVKEYSAAEPMFLVHKDGASSSKYVFGVRQVDCRRN